MSASLSFQTHAHLLSRAFIACALYFYVTARENSAKRSWAACGFFLSLAFCCRPFETAFLALPFGIELLWSAAKGDRSLARGVAIAVAGGLIPGPSLRGARVGAHWESASSAETLERGGEQRHPRGRRVDAVRVEFDVQSLVMLTVWFLGPLGCLLVAFGVLVDRLSRLLSLSVVSVLALGLFHSNTGIHLVGPIHYSECAVPLTVLAVFGARAIRDALAAREESGSRRQRRSSSSRRSSAAGPSPRSTPWGFDGKPAFRRTSTD